MATEVTNFPRESTMREVANALNMIAIAQASNAGDLDSWDAVQQLVRQGMGPKAFPVGSQLRCTHGVYGEIIWDVVAHDYNKNPEDADGHSMDLLAHACPISSLQYDQIEALYYCATELAAGTYHFTVANQNWYTADNGVTYQFTLAGAVPAGGQLVLNMTYNAALAGKTVRVYASRTTTTISEEATLSAGSGGTSLGTTDGASPNMNHMHRAIFGSNNWRESAMRQVLNSAAVAGSVWTPQTIYDRPPTWVSSEAGFLHGLPSDFLAVIGACNRPTRTNSIFEITDTLSSSYTTSDKIYLPSYTEITGSADGTVADGTQFPFYVGAVNADRIKYNTSGTARYWWLRSPYPGYAFDVSGVGPDGTLGGSFAYYAFAVAPACTIY